MDRLSQIIYVICSVFVLSAFSIRSHAQLADQPLNATFHAQLPYNVRLSNIWGYRHPSGREYALVGAYNGVSIVEVTVPTQPVEVVFIPGGSTIWRELKTFGNYMYVVSEQVNEGLLIADLSDLPNNNVTYQYKRLHTVNTDTVRNSHTLYIDNGYLYLAGTNLYSGAPLIFNLNTNPTQPQYLSTVGNVYAHDVYVRGDTLWGAHIYVGYFTAYNINNRSNPVFIAQQNTSFNFTHNVWLSDNSQFLFSTDERSSAYVDAYDVSDLTDIKLLDKWRTPQVGEQTPIPHNVHVHNDYVVTAYYTEGIKILDGSVPDNLIEIASFDTYPFLNNGFYGCWGVYPYLPSGVLIASDINTGLHVFSVDYRRAARIQGTVTAQSNGQPLDAVSVEIINTTVSERTNLAGVYKTGYHSAGNYQVRFRKTGFLPEIRNVQLIADSVITLNIVMQTASNISCNGRVENVNQTGLGIAQAQVRLNQSAYDYSFNNSTNGTGDFSQILQPEEYEFLAAYWGFNTSRQIVDINGSSANLLAELDSAYYDDFSFDLGWTVQGSITTGAWERYIPNLSYQWGGMMPRNDMLNDFDKYCYLTGFSQSRMDTGYSDLKSPLFNASRYNDPYISFHYWLTSFDSTYSVSRDSLEVFLTDGVQNVKVATYYNGLYNWSTQKNYKISDFLNPTNQMQVVFRIHNSNAANYKEAGIDKFQVGSLSTVTNTEIVESTSPFFIDAYPNPSQAGFKIHYKVNLEKELPWIRVYDLMGRLVEQIKIDQNSAVLETGQNWPSGKYILQLGNQSKIIIKQ